MHNPTAHAPPDDPLPPPAPSLGPGPSPTRLTLSQAPSQFLVRRSHPRSSHTLSPSTSTPCMSTSTSNPLEQPAGCRTDYICEGPLLGVCGLSPESVAAGLAEWEKLGRQLAVQLGFDHDSMDEIQRCVCLKFVGRAVLHDGAKAPSKAAHSCLGLHSLCASDKPLSLYLLPACCYCIDQGETPLSAAPAGCACTITTCLCTSGWRARCGSTGSGTRRAVGHHPLWW